MDKKNARVLLIDDSAVFSGVALEILRKAGCAAERAENGLEGVKMTYSFLPHVVITGADMPLFSGRQTVRLLKSRKNARNIPVIALIAPGSHKDRFWAAHAGADRVLEKTPENLPLLPAYVSELLEKTPAPDMEAIAREGARAGDDALIESMNTMLDARLLDASAAAMLAGLSARAESTGDVVKGVFDLLNTICEAHIASVIVPSARGAAGTPGTIYVYGANFSGFTKERADDFAAISMADFNAAFPDIKIKETIRAQFGEYGGFDRKNESYMTLPLISNGVSVGTFHVANTVKEYFTPPLGERIGAFMGSASPVIANAMRLAETREALQKTRVAFSRYVPPEVIDDLVRRSAAPERQSEKQDVTILFSDIRDFTRISENSEARNIVSFLNHYFSVMGNEIIAAGGHVDKFIGDAIMAVFGAPRALDDAPARAVRAALNMIAALGRVNTARIRLPPRGLAFGVGIHSGECVVGNIGFQDKLDYTCIGDTVNLASRLEGVTKIYRHPLIVSETVRNAVKDEFLFRKIDTIRVKGKERPSGIYAVYAGFRGEDAADFTPPSTLAHVMRVDRAALDCYDKGLSMYRMGERARAREYFLKALEHDPSDGLSRLYLDRCDQNPPPDGEAALVAPA